MAIETPNSSAPDKKEALQDAKNAVLDASREKRADLLSGGLMDTVNKVFGQLSVFGQELVKGLNKFMESLGFKTQEVKKLLPDALAPAAAAPEKPAAKIDAKDAEGRLKQALAAHADWNDVADAAAKTYGVSKGAMFAFIDFESRFDPDAKNRKSSARGLGQFMNGTWEEFMREDGFNWFDPDVKQNNPHASLYAVAWYMHKNAKAFGIDPSNPESAYQLYMLHHEGAGGYRIYLNYKNGGAEPSLDEDRQESYKVKTYAEYAAKIEGFAAKVQATAQAYEQGFSVPSNLNA